MLRRQQDALEAKAGIEAAHLVEIAEEPQERMCIHFDHSVVSLWYVRRAALQAGADLQERYLHLLANIAPRPARMARRLAAELARIPGVLEAVIAADDSRGSTVLVVFNTLGLLAYSRVS